MTVSQILAQKGRHVTTLRPSHDLRDAVKMLAVEHIGSLVITDEDGRMMGILSERDVVRAIAQRGCEALDDAVTTVMTRNVVTGREEDSVISVVQRMSQGRFRHMPILKDGCLIGMVSTGDAVKFRLAQMEEEQSALREYIATA